jgi:hypothetical protein
VNIRVIRGLFKSDEVASSIFICLFFYLDYHVVRGKKRC